MTAPVHPGTIELVDDDKGTTERVPASAVPQTVAFIGDDAVVRIVHSTHEGRHTIRSYGADGQLLATTVGR